MKKKSFKSFIVEIVLAAMLVTSVGGMAVLSLDEAIASEDITSSSENTGSESETPSSSSSSSSTIAPTTTSSSTEDTLVSPPSSGQSDDYYSGASNSEPQNNGGAPARTNAVTEYKIISANIALPSNPSIVYSNGVPMTGVTFVGYKISIKKSGADTTSFGPTTDWEKTWKDVDSKNPTLDSYVTVDADARYVLNIEDVRIEKDGQTVSWNSINPSSWEESITPVWTEEGNNWGRVDFNVSSLTIKVNNEAKMPSTYDKLEDAEFGDDSKHSTIGLTFDGDEEKDTKTISKSRVGKILDYVYQNGPDNVRNAISDVLNGTDNKALSIAVVVTSKKDPPDKEKDALKDRAKDFEDAKDKDVKMGRYFDISVYLKVGNNVDENLKISDLGKSNPIHFKLDAAKGISSSTSSTTSSSSKGTRYYNAVRYHEGGHSVGIDEYQSDKNLEFDVYQFSTFATAYYDKSSSSSSNPNKSGSQSTANPSANRTPETGGGAPKTGDNFNPRIWIYLLIVCATVASAAWILLQDSNDDKEKEDKN